MMGAVGVGDSTGAVGGARRPEVWVGAVIRIGDKQWQKANSG